MLDFARTRIGMTLFDVTLPKIADQLEQLNANLRALVGALNKAAATPPTAHNHDGP
jgi:hypothetical protein